MGTINVAIIGIGNCASALIQGVHKYKGLEKEDKVPGIMHPVMGEYSIQDINFVAAFDVDKNKVGNDISEAIFAEPNNTVKFQKVPVLGVEVQRGMTHDGIGKYTKDLIKTSDEPTADIAQTLIDRKVDVLISYLPVGSEEATKWYVEQAITAKCAFITVCQFS